ncbi:MAG: flagellar basal body P-ring formation chaperone FlgA [Luminiphilus sp.]|nr:flagellar basal body P-ring formation chaperone FlgA [Luminiphilus sp.]MDG1461076.1 flagellar basal body P-ring formation chaperone FlgA [Luminiphilus sp.]
MSKHWRYALLGALTFTAAMSQADLGSHSLSDIASTAALTMQSRAADQGYQQIDVQVRPLDGRLALAKCTQALEALPSSSERALGAVSVGVRCPGEEIWTLYVRGEVSANQVIPVLSAALRRGDLIGKNDIILEKRRITQEYGGIVTEIEDLLGMEARRNLDPGSPLRFNDLVAPILVERGQTVNIISGSGGLRVSMQGKALAKGSAGDRVLVSNLTSGARVEGVVTPDGSVVIQ